MWEQICQLRTEVVVKFRYSRKHIVEPLLRIHITCFAETKTRREYIMAAFSAASWLLNRGMVCKCLPNRPEKRRVAITESPCLRLLNNHVILNEKRAAQRSVSRE